MPRIADGVKPYEGYKCAVLVEPGDTPEQVADFARSVEAVKVIDKIEHYLLTNGKDLFLPNPNRLAKTVQLLGGAEVEEVAAAV